MINVVTKIKNLDFEKFRQASLESRREVTQFMSRMYEMFEQERDKLRKKITLGNNEMYLVGISKEPWNKMRFLIGTEQDYKRIVKNRGENDYMIGERI